MTNERNKIDFIQALRGIAALSVTIFHSRGHLPNSSSSPFADWLFSAGASGVDIFFMLSGFIMVLTTRNSNGSIFYFLKFIIKRLSRIWPVYVILTLIYIIVMTISDNIIQIEVLKTSFSETIKSLLFIPLILNKADGPFWGGSVLHTGWTLNYEFYFYIIFAISLLFGKFRWIALFGWATLTLLILPFSYGNVSFDPKSYYGWNGYINLVTSPLLWEFFIGVIVGLIYHSKIKIKSEQVCRMLCLFSISLTAWMLLSKMVEGFGLLNWGIPFTILFTTLAISSKTINIKVPNIFIWLGNISFSLYMVHPIIIHPFANIIWEYAQVRESLKDMSYVIFLTVISIIFSAISYEFLENRLSNWVRSKLLSLLPKNPQVVRDNTHDVTR